MNLENILSKSIKVLLVQYPKFEDLLRKFDLSSAIQCEGRCSLNEILLIHNMVEDDKQVFLNNLTALLFPEEKIKFPQVRKQKSPSNKLEFSIPIKNLIIEHNKIKEQLQIIQGNINILKPEDKID